MNVVNSSVPSSMMPLFQPRRAAFWLLCLALIGGVHTTIVMILNGWSVMPVSVAVGLAMWALYSLPLLLLFRRLDVFRGQTASALLLAFAWGGLGAVYLALPANQAVFGILAKLVGPEFTHQWGAAIAGPSDEEPLKLLGVILLVLIAPGRFHSISSVMALGALVGLGFQVVENFSYTINGALNHPNANQFEPVVQMMLMRGVVCGLWSHAAYTAIASFGVGYFVAHRDKLLVLRFLVATAAIIAAWSMHAIWNSPLPEAILKNAGLIFLYLPLKGLPVLIASLLLWRVARSDNAFRG